MRRPPTASVSSACAAELAADAVERDRHRRRPRSRPARLGVVDGDVGAERAHALDLLGPPAAPTTVAPALRAACTSRLPMPPAAAVISTVSAAVSARDLEDRHRRAAGADHRDRGVVGDAVGQRVHGVGLAHGELGVAAARRPEVGDDAAAEPRLVGARRRARRRRRRPRGRGSPAARAAGTGPADTPLRTVVSIRCTPAAATAIRTWPGAGAGIVDLLVAQVPGGPELAQDDRAHHGQEEVGVAELVPAVAVGRAPRVRALDQVAAGDRLEHQQVARVGLVPAGEQPVDHAGRRSRA